VIVLPNNLVFQAADEEEGVDRLFDSSDGWMVRVIRALSNPIFRPGPIPADIASFRNAIRGDESRALFSTCRVATSEGVDAVRKGLFDCPLRSPGLERVKAERLLICIGFGRDLGISGFSEIARSAADLFDCKEEATVALWRDDRLGEDLEVTVIARTILSATPTAQRVLRPVEVHQSKLKSGKKSKHSPPERQTEFDSLLEHNERGLFGRLEVDAYDGIDLDKPTFLRRGIKIPMPKH